MSRILVAGFFLAVSAAMVTDVKKKFPAWPNVYSATILITDPNHPTAGQEKGGEVIAKIWYDGEAGKVRKEIPTMAVYAFRDYEGRGIYVQQKPSGGCRVNYGKDAVKARLTNPLAPQFDRTGSEVEFLGEVDVNGQQVELWQWQADGRTIANIYLRLQDSVAIPVKFEFFPEIPAMGSDTILPVVVDVKDFSTSKPAASVFEIDISKCIKASPLLSFMKLM